MQIKQNQDLSDNQNENDRNIFEVTSLLFGLRKPVAQPAAQPAAQLAAQLAERTKMDQNKTSRICKKFHDF